MGYTGTAQRALPVTAFTKINVDVWQFPDPGSSLQFYLQELPFFTNPCLMQVMNLRSKIVFIHETKAARYKEEKIYWDIFDL